MKRIFRSRLPPALTDEQIERFSHQSNLSVEEIEEWYERFNHCYPRGYLTFNEFVQYLQQFQKSNQRENFSTKKTLIKKLFRLLDFNEDKNLNFDEFFFFNILMTRGTTDEKLRFIFRLYDEKKEKFLTDEQLENVLNQMFEILMIPKPTNGFSSSINEIVRRTKITREKNEISWNIFRSFVLEDESLFRLLFPSRSHHESSSLIITTRF